MLWSSSSSWSWVVPQRKRARKGPWVDVSDVPGECIGPPGIVPTQYISSQILTCTYTIIIAQNLHYCNKNKIILHTKLMQKAALLEPNNQHKKIFTDASSSAA